VLKEVASSEANSLIFTIPSLFCSFEEEEEENTLKAWL
jgi:hypothetical protein